MPPRGWQFCTVFAGMLPTMTRRCGAGNGGQNPGPLRDEIGAPGRDFAHPTDRDDI